jgi:hypothetical protein
VERRLLEDRKLLEGFLGKRIRGYAGVLKEIVIVRGATCCRREPLEPAATEIRDSFRRLPLLTPALSGGGE